MKLISNKVKKVFFSKESSILDEQNKLDIILSPEFYWVRVFDLPIKNINKAKMILPSMFEEFIGDVSDLSYKIVKRDDDKFICFAYSNKEILNSLKNANVNFSLINSIYFAQTELIDYKQFKFSDEYFSYVGNDILVKLPMKSFDEQIKDISLEIDNIKLSSNKIDFKLYNNFISSKQVNIVLVLLAIISVINFSKYFIYESHINKLQENTNELFSQNNLPLSVLQVNSIISNKQNKIDIEIKKREVLNYLSNIKSIDLSSFNIKNRVFEIVLKDEKMKDQIIKDLGKSYKVTTTKLSKNTKIRIAL